MECAVLAVGGWADAYVDAIFRMLERLDCPRRALIGPWGHQWPQYGHPGPQVGFLQEAVRWWDHWLKGVDNGAMDGPMLRAWMPEAVRPAPDYAHRPGRWIAEPALPATSTSPLALALTDQRACGRQRPVRTTRRRCTTAAARPSVSTPAPGARTRCRATCRSTSAATTRCR